MTRITTCETLPCICQKSIWFYLVQWASQPPRSSWVAWLNQPFPVIFGEFGYRYFAELVWLSPMCPCGLQHHGDGDVSACVYMTKLLHPWDQLKSSTGLSLTSSDICSKANELLTSSQILDYYSWFGAGRGSKVWFSSIYFGALSKSEVLYIWLKFNTYIPYWQHPTPIEVEAQWSMELCVDVF